MKAAPEVPHAFNGVMTACSPIVRTWARLEVSGLEHLPPSGPTLLASNHDSWWDPIVIGTAAVGKRQIRALAKSSLWKNPLLARVLDGMGQIPIERGKGDAHALERAIADLRAGACVGIFLEGTRSRGRQLRARSGFGWIAKAVPEAEVVCCTVIGSTDLVRFPTRPTVHVRFFRPAGGGPAPEETAGDFTARLLAEIRAEAPVMSSGRRPPRALPGG